MLRFDGDKDFAQPPGLVWTKLSDARFLVQCVPGAEGVACSEATKVVCTLRPGFAFVRGTLELTLLVTDLIPESSARILLHTKGIGSTSDVEASLAVSPEGAGTRLHWVAEIKTLGGLLKAVPQGLVKAAARKVIDDAMAALESRLKS
jgi:carbon monoxide dehydrogenase subunit G